MPRLLFYVLLTGCSSGLDDLLLSGGGRAMQPHPDLGTSKSDDPSTPPATPPPEDPTPEPVPTTTPMPSPTPSPIVTAQCTSFDNDTLGQTPAGWTNDYGSWVVKEYGGTRILRQQQNAQNNDEDFVISYGDRAWTDLTASVHVYTMGWGSDDCVVARYNGPDSNYALCVEIDTTRMPPLNRWKLTLHIPGRNNDVKLAEAAFQDLQPEHDLSLKVAGSTLTPVIDGVEQPAIQNTGLATGSVALSTEVSGTQFGRFCLVRP